MSTANVVKLAYVGRQPGTTARDSDSWFTPASYIERARSSLPNGVIDFDPFSSVAANRTVRANVYYTVDDDALTKEWPRVRSVWMNPPYSGALCSNAVNRFCDEYVSGTFDAGVILVNNATETKWFQRMLKLATTVCFTSHRISFENIDGKRKSGTTRGQAFLYFGLNSARFTEAFSDVGAVIDLENVT